MWKHVDDTPWDQVSGMELITGNYDIGVSAFVPRVLALWDTLEDQGFRIAGIGGSDDHTAGINEGTAGSEIGSPTTLVLADNLSEAAIIDAVKHGRTIVNLHGPDDPLVEVTMRKKDGTQADIGDDVDGVDDAHVSVHVAGGNGDFVYLCPRRPEDRAEAGDERRLQDDVRRRARRPGAALPGRADLRHQHADRDHQPHLRGGDRGGGLRLPEQRLRRPAARCSSCSTP